MSGIKSTQVAVSVPFDNSTNGFDSTNVQSAIEEIGASASPGYSFGRNGGLFASTWLLNEGVPSNNAGRYVFIDNPVVSQVFVSSNTSSTFTLTFYEHDGSSINLTSLGSVTVTSARGGTFAVNWAATKGKQLAVRLTSGTANDLVVGCVLKGVSP